MSSQDQEIENENIEYLKENMILLKDEGNQAFKKKDWKLALSKYEEAVSIVPDIFEKLDPEI